MNPGKSWFNVPRPYVAHEPSDAWPSSWLPVCMSSCAGA